MFNHSIEPMPSRLISLTINSTARRSFVQFILPILLYGLEKPSNYLLYFELRIAFLAKIDRQQKTKGNYSFFS